MKMFVKLVLLAVVMAFTAPAFAQESIPRPPEVLCSGGPFGEGKIIDFPHEDEFGWHSMITDKGLVVSVSRFLAVENVLTSARVKISVKLPDGTWNQSKPKTNLVLILDGETIRCWSY